MSTNRRNFLSSLLAAPLVWIGIKSNIGQKSPVVFKGKIDPAEWAPDGHYILGIDIGTRPGFEVTVFHFVGEDGEWKSIEGLPPKKMPMSEYAWNSLSPEMKRGMGRA